MTVDERARHLLRELVDLADEGVPGAALAAAKWEAKLERVQVDSRGLRMLGQTVRRMRQRYRGW